MKWQLTLATFLWLLASLQAGERDKNKSTKPPVTPSERIEQLLSILKTDRKEDKRLKAAEELASLASSEYPEIVSGLIDALVRDSSTSVRKAVIHSLAAIEPATHEVKDALDQAVKSDKAWTVRQAARIALWRYKPKDEPAQVPEPKVRNSSKPTNTGRVPATKSSPLKPTPADPLKSMAMPPVPAPVVPAVPAPYMAPAPRLNLDLPVPGTPGSTTQLTAPKPAGN